MPPRRPPRGRHRKPKHHSGPAYVTAATLAAFAVSGLNVPGAIGDARAGEQSSQAVATQLQQASHDRRRSAAADPRRPAGAARQPAPERDAVRRARSCQADRQEGARPPREAARPKWVVPVARLPADRRLRRLRPVEQRRTPARTSPRRTAPRSTRSATARSSSPPTRAPTATRSRSSTPTAPSPGTPTCRRSCKTSGTVKAGDVDRPGRHHRQHHRPAPAPRGPPRRRRPRCRR